MTIQSLSKNQSLSITRFLVTNLLVKKNSRVLNKIDNTPIKVRRKVCHNRVFKNFTFGREEGRYERPKEIRMTLGLEFQNCVFEDLMSVDVGH